MAYRKFARPAVAQGPRSVQAWLDWMEEQGDILVPVAPRQPLSCTRCYGAAGYRDAGETWSTCWACRAYGDTVDTVVPVTYSLDAGLESMLHQYKDDPARWLRMPLASLLTVFVREHADCIEGDASGIDVAMLVPSDNKSRAFSHLDELLHGVVANDPVTRRFNWRPGAIVRDRLTKRPERGELKPRAYKVDPRDASDASVLLLDDTWTSGSSAASAAAALKAAGAHNVTVLTLGRQLNLGSNFGSTEAICHDRRGALWSRDRCVLCA